MAKGLIRFCPLCLRADTDPRHVINGDDPNVARHMDCCRAFGCPDGSCPIVTKGIEELRGDDLREALINPRRQERIQRELDQRSDETRHFTTAGIPVTLQGAEQ